MTGKTLFGEMKMVLLLNGNPLKKSEKYCEKQIILKHEYGYIKDTQMEGTKICQ